MDEIRLTIDGKEVTTTRGRTILDAAIENGIDIPTFCWHPKLKSIGACRICLVEVEKWPKLQVSCATPAADGMVVYTNNDRVIKARRGVIEFILLNHPLDCPTCDKGGECPLQDVVFRYGIDKARTVEPRQRFIVDENSTFDDLPIGPEIIRNQNRCIHCFRCVRIVDEIAGAADLGAYERGHGTEILPPPGEEIRNLYSGNVVEYCPVGALTNRDFRYKVRVWLTEQKKTVCSFCPDGCNLTAWTFRNKVFRATSRRNDHVDEGLICDIGRYGYQFVHHADRLSTPMIKRGGQLVECSWEEAGEAVIGKLLSTKEKHGPQGIAALVGEDLPNEDYYVLGKFLRSVVGSNSIDHRLYRKKKLSHSEDLKRLGIIGSNMTFEDMEKADLFVIIGSDLQRENPISVLRMLKTRRGKGAGLVFISSEPGHLPRFCDRYVHRYNTEVEVLTCIARIIVQKKLCDAGEIALDDRQIEKFLNETDDFTLESVSKSSGMAPGDLERLAERIARSGRTVFVTGRHIALHYQRDMILTALYNLALVTNNLQDDPKRILVLRPGANSRGCYLLGVRPDRLPVNIPIEQRERLFPYLAGGVPDRKGGDTVDILRRIGESRVELAFTVGADPVTVYPDRNCICSTLSKLDFLVVADLYLTETAKLADVVLPMTSHYETAGSFCNWEGRVQVFEQVVKPIHQSRPAWRIFTDLAARLEVEFGYAGAEDVFDEFVSLIPDGSHLSFRTFPESGIRIPSGTPLLKSAELQRISVKPPEVDEAHRYYLITGNGDHHIGRNKTIRSESLNRFQQEPFVGLSESTANELALSEGDLVRVENGSGKIIGAVRYIDGLNSDVVWLADNFQEMTPNTLRNRDLDIDRVSLIKV